MSIPPEQYLESLKNVSREAEETDYIMPIILPFVPAIIAIIGTIIALIGVAAGGAGRTGVALAGAGIAWALYIVAAIIFIYVYYKWIDRRNNHFSRMQKFFENLTSYLESKGVTDPELSSIKSTYSDMKYKETKENPFLWAILSAIIGIIALYVYHFLNKHFHQHEIRERRILESLKSILNKRGIYFEVPEQTVPNRNTIIYIILTIITIGIFGIYWIYTLTKDPNNHFVEHKKWEEKLLDALARI